MLNDALGKLHDGAKSFDTIEPVAAQKLGGLSGLGAAVKIVNGEGTIVRVLLSALDGRNHTYLVQSFSANPGPALTEAQAVLNTLELTE